VLIIIVFHYAMCLGTHNTRIGKCTELCVFRFIDWYRQKLEPATLYMEHSDGTYGDVSQLLGARRHYYTLLDHYEMQLKTKCDNSLVTLIAQNFPSLSTGLAGSALHGLIQLGYGCAASNPRFQLCIILLMCSFLVFYFIPVTFSFWSHLITLPPGRVQSN